MEPCSVLRDWYNNNSIMNTLFSPCFEDSDGHSCRTESHHDLHLRPPDHAVASRDPTSTGAPRPHTGAELLAQNRTRVALPQLAARPVQQPPRPVGVLEADYRTQGHRRSCRGDDADQPVRFLPRRIRRNVSVHLRCLPRQGTNSVPRNSTHWATLAAVGRCPSQSGHHHQRLHCRTQSSHLEAGEVHHPHGAGRSEAGRDARTRERFVPRFGVVVGAIVSAPGTRGAILFRLPDSTRRGRKAIGRRPRRTVDRLYRPPCLGRNLLAGRGVDWPRSDFRTSHG